MSSAMYALLTQCELPDPPAGGGRGRVARYRRSTFVGIVLLAALCGYACQRGAKEASKRYFGSGLDYFGQEKYGAASIQFRNAIQGDVRAWAPRYWLAVAELKLRHWPEAYKELNRVIELEPSLGAARLELAELLLLGNKESEARAQINEVLSVSPQNVRALVLLGRTYFRQKEFGQALEEYKKAQDLAPRDAALWT